MSIGGSGSEVTQTFDPDKFLIVPARKFEDLRVGEVFRAPSRTLTDAHAAAFQTVSADNHRSITTSNGQRDTDTALQWSMVCRSWLSLPQAQPFFRITSERSS
jgi:hypothetical protein